MSTISSILAEIDEAKGRREEARVRDNTKGMEEVRDHLGRLRINLEYAIRDSVPFDKPTDAELFYSVHRDRITQVACALIMDPDTSHRFMMSTPRLVDEAAAIVSEIARRGGDTPALPGKVEMTDERFDAMA